MTEKIILCAQPDEPNFHWQVEVWLYSLRKLGLEEGARVLFAYRGAPSERARRIQKWTTGKVFFYEDSRSRVYYDPEQTGQTTYIPTIRPHVIKKYFAETGPHTVFYCDCDIAFFSEPDWADLWSDQYHYGTDTGYYTNATYLRGKDSYSENAFRRMCDLVGIRKETVMANERHTIGAQYLIKNSDENFWHKVELDSEKLYRYCNQFNQEFRQDRQNEIQAWCADMWAVLWNLWLRGEHTRVSPALMHTMQQTNIAAKTAIYHDSGAVRDSGEVSKRTFWKRDYATVDPYDADFSHIDPTFCCSLYCDLIKETGNQLNKPMKQRILALMYTDLSVDPDILNAVINRIAQAARESSTAEVKLVCVTQKPFEAITEHGWTNKVIPFKERSHRAIAAQILKGMQGETADIVTFLEHDCLYPHEYFDRVVKHFAAGSQVFVNYDYIGMNDTGYVNVKQRDICLSQLSMRYEYALMHFKEKLYEASVNGSCYLDAFDTTVSSSVGFYGNNPVVHVNHTHHFTNHYDLCYEKTAFTQNHPYWGEFGQYYPLNQKVAHEIVR